MASSHFGWVLLNGERDIEAFIITHPIWDEVKKIS
jgi:hypothetical protein